jgi:hypothetical protein
MKAGKNGSEDSTPGSLVMTSPSAKAFETDKERARLLGRQPSSSAAARIRSTVAWARPGRPFSANETAPLDTPARLATSAIVGRSLLIKVLEVRV